MSCSGEMHRYDIEHQLRRQLTKPLPYQLTNRTHAHLLPPEFSSYNDAIKWPYGVLFQISLGYPPVEGRLHTRYAPVRRSSAKCKHFLLPLDLHVLSLPLAFILSQDQTLRCCFLIYFHKQLKIDMVKMVLFTCIFRYALSFFIFILSMNLCLRPDNDFV